MRLALPFVVASAGCAALIFETLWFRQAGLALGNSIWASSLVLAAFMAGLAVGNLLAARWGDRVHRPLRVYVVLESLIAVTGVGLVLALPAIAPSVARFLRPVADRPEILNGCRLLIAFALLLVPSTAMGSALPLLTRSLTAVHGLYGTTLGRLYGWNTVGGVVGVLAGESFLVGALGIRGTALVAGAVSLIAAGTALWLAARHRASPLQAREPELSGAPSRAWRHGRPLLAAAFVSGFCLLALEVIWFRLLLLFVLGNSLAFAVMLAVVLSGVGLGGLTAAFCLRRSDTGYRWSAEVTLAMATLLVATYAWFPRVAASYEGRLIQGIGDMLYLGVPLMFPVSFGSGLLFTLLGAALREGRTLPAETTGTLTLANTAGSALGSLSGGFLLLPVLGIERSLLVIAALYICSGLWLMRASRARTMIPLLGAAAIALALFPSGTLEGRLISTTIHRFEAIRGPVPAESTASISVAAVREGRTETIVYARVSDLGRPIFYQLFTNAISMADTEYVSRRYMKLYAYWPLAVHPRLERALVICYGIGNTAKALTDSSMPRSIDIVDISRDVLESNDVVYGAAHDSPLTDPRVHVHIEDGRYFLQSTEQRFDLITAEPPPPTAAGAVNLYTREYFTLLRDRLAPGGIVAYWLPLHALSEAATKSVLRAFCDAFADCSLWNGMGAQLMMIGSRGLDASVSDEQFVRQWRDVKTVVEMKRLGLERPEQLGALFIGDADFLNRLTADSEPLTDDRPKRIDAPASDRRAANELLAALTDTEAARERFERSPLIERWWPARMRAASTPYFETQRLINSFAYGGTVTIGDVHAMLTQTSLSTPIMWILGSDWDSQQAIIDAAPKDIIQPAMQWHFAIRLIAERSFLAAAEAFRRAESAPQYRTSALRLRVFAMAMGGRQDAARQLMTERLTANELAAPFWQVMRQTFAW